MRLEDEKVTVEVDAVRQLRVMVGTAPDDPRVFMDTFAPSLHLHVPMTPRVARDVAAALVAFADQIDAR